MMAMFSLEMGDLLKAVPSTRSINISISNTLDDAQKRALAEVTLP